MNGIHDCAHSQSSSPKSPALPYGGSFLQAFLDKNDTELCIVMEFCGCGDLAQKVDRYKKRKQAVDERVIWAYMIQVFVDLSMKSLTCTL